MKVLRILNKEQWTALIVSVIALYGVAGSAWGGGSGATEVPSAEERGWRPAPARFSDAVDPEFKKYCPEGALGRVFKAEATTKLDIPVLPPPEPREGALTAPLFRPGPRLTAYNAAEQIKMKYVPMIPGTPAVPSAGLPTPEQVQALVKMEEPTVEPVKDRRADREREFFQVKVKKTGAVREGKKTLVNATEIWIKNKNGQLEKWKKSDLASWQDNPTYEELYHLDSSRIQPGPKEPAERVKLAKRQVELGMIPEAMAELRKAIEAKPDYVPAIVMLGDMLFDQMDLDGAVKVYEAGLEAGAVPHELHYRIGKVLLALNFTEGAAEAFAKSVTLSPRFKEGRLALARMHLRLGQLDRVVKDLKDFLIRFGRDLDTTDDHRREANLILGLAHLRAGRIDKAKEHLAEALKFKAEDAEAQNAMGVVLGLQGKAPEAGIAFIKALQADQYLTDAWCNLGVLMLLAGRADDAEAAYAAAAQRDPLAAEPLAGIGMARILAGKKDEGVASLDRALALDPTHVAALATKAHLKLLDGANAEALKLFEKTLQAEYDYLPAWYGTAMAYLRDATRVAMSAQTQRDRAKAGELYARAQRSRVNAEALLNGARRFDSGNPQVWIALGCTYAVMGRSDDAVRALKSAAALGSATQPDPLVNYAKGFVDYWYAPAEDAKERLGFARTEFVRGANLNADPKDPHAVRAVALCKKAVEEIDNWNDTSIRLSDTFSRPEGDQVGGGWLESDKRYGIQISLASTDAQGGHARFEGMQKIADMGVTMMDHQIPAGNFHSLEMTFRPEQMPKAELGMSLFTAKQGQAWMGFHLGRDMQGKLRYRNCLDSALDRNDMQIGWTPLKVQPPSGAELRLKVERVEKKRQDFLVIWAYDASAGDWMELHRDLPLPVAKRDGQWKIGVWGRGWKDQEYAFTVDDVRVYERKRR